MERLGAAGPGSPHTPFLLELALHTAEEHPELRADPEALLRTAAEVADDRHEYIQQWFHTGSASSTGRPGAGRWRAAGLPVTLPAPGEPAPAGRRTARPAVLPAAAGRSDDAASYGAAAGADGQDRARGGASLADDPVLARHLPEVLRVHHISDLHHGGGCPRRWTPRTRRRPAAASPHWPAQGPRWTAIWTTYASSPRTAAPRTWWSSPATSSTGLRRPRRAGQGMARPAGGTAGPHRDLRPADPRVLLVGGNHDVSWDLALDPSPQARHRWFAANFAGLPHPDLHLADPSARRLYVGYRGVGLRFALLGSAESGGEAARDEDRETCCAASGSATSGRRRRRHGRGRRSGDAMSRPS